MIRPAYCATTNAGKLREFRMALDIEPLPGLNGIEPPEETGVTFEENAILKARYYSRFTVDPLVAEDSGLEVDSLGGKPGVHSARFAGPNATDDDNNRLLLELLRGVLNRTARFVCVIALAQNGELIRTFRGAVEGSISEEPRGSHGFGYDPLFFYPPFGCTFGEAPAKRKMDVSHRSRAIAAMIAYVRSASR